MIIGILFYLAVGLLIFFAIKGRKREKKYKKATIALSDDLKEMKTETTVQKTGPAVQLDPTVQIYRHEAAITGWCCPNCQCENDYSHSNCCVCNYKK